MKPRTQRQFWTDSDRRRNVETHVAISFTVQVLIVIFLFLLGFWLIGKIAENGYEIDQKAEHLERSLMERI